MGVGPGNLENLEIGDGTGKNAFWQSDLENILIYGTSVVIRQGGTWKMNGFNDGLNQIALEGGTVDGLDLTFGFGRGTLTLNGGTSTATGDVQSRIVTELTLNGTNTFDVADGAAAVDLLIDGAIAGDTLLKTGTGTLRLTGAPLGILPRANAHSDTQVELGTLELGKVAGTNAVGGSLRVGDFGLAAGSATVRWLASNQTGPDAEVLLDDGAALDLNGFNESFRTVGFPSLAGNASVNTAGGTLTITDTIGALQRGSINGAINLAGNIVDFVTFATSAEIAITGGINNGTINKIGAGRLTLANTTGNSILNAAQGSISSTGGLAIRGLYGAAPVEIASGTMTINTATGADFNYSGVLSGAGALNKTGQGTMRFSGSSPNTLSGSTFVGLGKLLLSKTGNARSVSGDLTIAANATVEATTSNQFGGGVDSNVSGQLILNSTFQSMRSLTVHPDGKLSASASSTLNLSHGATFNNATTGGNPGLSVAGGGLQVTNGSDVTLHGFVNGTGSIVDSTSELTVDVNGVLGSGSELQFAAGLHLHHGSTLAFRLQNPAEIAPLDVNGGLLVGTPITLFGNLLTMFGTTTIELSGNTSITTGTYDLIDFATNPYTDGSFGGVIYPQLSNFVLGTHPGIGHLQVTSNILQYVSETMAADFDEDGDVDDDDLATWSANYGMSNAVHASGDATGDGRVNGRDFLVWQRQYTAVGPAIDLRLVPEPTTLLLAIVSLLASGWNRTGRT